MSRNHAEKFAPIEKIMVSTNIGDNAELKKIHEKMVFQLLKGRNALGNHYSMKELNGVTNGKPINSDGKPVKGGDDEKSEDPDNFSLTNLEEKIVKKGDAYIFLPIPAEIKHRTAPVNRDFYKEMFKAASLFVGTQTADPELHLAPEKAGLKRTSEGPLKPIVLVNYKDCWRPFYDLVHHMHKMGTIKQNPDDVVHMINVEHDKHDNINIDPVIELLQKAHTEKLKVRPSHESHSHAPKKIPTEHDSDESRKPEFNVCVFCSASTRNEGLIDIAYKIGHDIARQGWGLISGMGKTGMMGAVVEGASQVIKSLKRGWNGGSNLPRIVHMEGLPDYFDKYWEKPDIYTRMEIMIEKSQAFVIMPGGMGTVQELMALLLLKHNAQKGKRYLMNDDKFANKPIIIVNHKVDGETPFWQPLVEMSKKFGFKDDVIVVDTIEEAMEVLRTHHDRRQSRKQPASQRA